MKNYVIVSNKHANSNEWHWLFWREGAAGYTFNLDEAGLFPENYGYPVVETRGDLWEHETCMVHIDQLDILGRIQTCIER